MVVADIEANSAESKQSQIRGALSTSSLEMSTRRRFVCANYFETDVADRGSGKFSTDLSVRPVVIAHHAVVGRSALPSTDSSDVRASESRSHLQVAIVNRSPPRGLACPGNAFTQLFVVLGLR